MKSFRDMMSEASGNLPGQRTHIINKDIRHPEHGIITTGTVVRHVGGNQYELRAGRARGKIIPIDRQHVDKMSMEEIDLDEAISTTPPAKVGFNDIVVRKHESGNHEVVRRGGAYMHLKKGELLSKSDMKDMSSNRAKFHLEEVDQSDEAQLEEGFKKGDFIKTPTGEIHRVFGVTGNSLETAPYRGKNGYGGGTTVHKTKATKVPTPKDVTEEVELDEAIKLGTKVKIHAPGKDYHDKVGHVGEIRDGLFKGAPKKYTIDYDHNPATGHSKSVQLDKKNVKLHTEEVELDELNKSTLGSYVKKASKEVADKAWKAGTATHPDRLQQGKLRAKAFFKAKSRMAGIDKATDRLANEEVELDEGDELGIRMGSSGPGFNKTPAGKAREVKRKQENLKGQMKFTKSQGGITGPKGNLPEETVSHDSQQIDEMTQGKSYTQQQLSDKIKSGNWEAVTDIKPGKHVEMRHHSGKRVTVHVKEQTQGEPMSTMEQYLAAIGGSADFRSSLQEKTLTPAELKKREEVAKAIERENPGMDKSKKMAIATATAKKVAEDTHYCAKHVFSERFGEGMVIEGAHAEPDEQGLIEWYDVDFGGTVRRVMTEKVKVMHAEYHMNHKKKMKEEEEDSAEDEAEDEKEMGMKEATKPHTIPKTEREKDLAAAAHPKDKITHKDILVKRGVVATEELKGEMHPDAAKVLKHIKPEHHSVYKPFLKKGVYKGDYADRSAVLSAAEKAGHIQEDVEQIDELSKSTLGSYAKKASAAAADSSTSHMAYGSAAQRAGLDGDKKNAADWKKSADLFAQRAAKRQTGVGKAIDRMAKEDVDMNEAMISYSDFQDKIAAHRKAGNKVVDDKYDEKKASYTTIDKEGVGKKITHTPTGSKQEHLGNLKGDDDQAEVKPTEKRGRGRPSGTKSGARH